nr:MAG TPA: hypothetical protein [Caudoviricetes sp.]
MSLMKNLYLLRQKLCSLILSALCVIDRCHR